MVLKRELNYMNAIACLLVILIHVLSLGISLADSSSWQAAVIYFPWRLSAFVVPMFIYNGAVKMALKFIDTEVTINAYLQYFLHRIQKIYIPYVMWVIIYYTCFKIIGYVHGDPQEFLSYLLIGNLSSPFYYIIIIMQFYFLMPLWIWIVKHIPAYLGIGISLLITFFMQQFPYILSIFGVNFPYSDRIFLTYIIFWIVGLYVGKNYSHVASTLSGKSKQSICVVVILICSILAYIQYSQCSLGLNMNDIKMVSDFLSIMLIHSIGLKLTHAPRIIQKFTQHIYKCSFFVYLSHCLFLTLGTAFLQHIGVNTLSWLLIARFFICYSFPFISYLIYSKICTRFNLHNRFLG